MQIFVHDATSTEQGRRIKGWVDPTNVDVLVVTFVFLFALLHLRNEHFTMGIIKFLMNMSMFTVLHGMRRTGKQARCQNTWFQSCAVYPIKVLRNETGPQAEQKDPNYSLPCGGVPVTRGSTRAWHHVT